MRFFPKETDFFELFDRAALNLTKGASVLVELMQNYDNIDLLCKQLYEVEQDGDMVTHDIMKKLNSTFVTPIDREDLHALASRIDDVLDMIWAAVDRLVMFKLDAPTPAVVAISKDLLLTTEVIVKAIKKLREKNYQHVQEYCIEINRLENKIDHDFRTALCDLFNNTTDAIYIIKWKEIYELLEDASDRCEDVANILEAIMLKYA
ncbi:MAG: DUF47 family protein [Dissulfurispiraceae bacterium]|jgi:predicted phosphate transport protein (TIGR00153 family)|nr:DUF47 family protein [Dissulfurispiraceae bacterium]